MALLFIDSKFLFKLKNPTSTLKKIYPIFVYVENSDGIKTQFAETYVCV